MTRKELQLREQIACAAYKTHQEELYRDLISSLILRNEGRKLYRFRRPEQYEVDDIRNQQVYMCRPMCYEDMGDCEWLDNIEELTEKAFEEKGYSRAGFELTDEIRNVCRERLLKKPRYAELKKILRNLCLVACLTDTKTTKMWNEYASNSEGVCLEYDLEEVLKEIEKHEDLELCPVRYVEDRKKTKDIMFDSTDYFSEEADSIECLRYKYYLSCMTKDRIPYVSESEWRLICFKTDIPIQQEGKKVGFLKPSKIYLGRNIDRNLQFKSEIIKAAEEQRIDVVQEM